MEFLPKNKWLALIVFILIIVVAVFIASSAMRLKPDENAAGNFRFSLGLKKKKNVTT